MKKRQKTRRVPIEYREEDFRVWFPKLESKIQRNGTSFLFKWKLQNRSSFFPKLTSGETSSPLSFHELVRTREEESKSSELQTSQLKSSHSFMDRNKTKGEKERENRLEWVKKERPTLRTLRSRGKKVSEVIHTEWKEEVVRVGTGYRVRKDEKDPRKRRFDVGYSDLKTYTRKDGREAVIDSSNMRRTVTGKGKDSRVRVINAVSAMEKRRPASEYTGSGILRKSRVGTLKLKPTKATGKD